MHSYFKDFSHMLKRIVSLFASLTHLFGGFLYKTVLRNTGLSCYFMNSLSLVKRNWSLQLMQTALFHASVFFSGSLCSAWKLHWIWRDSSKLKLNWVMGSDLDKPQIQMREEFIYTATSCPFKLIPMESSTNKHQCCHEQDVAFQAVQRCYQCIFKECPVLPSILLPPMCGCHWPEVCRPLEYRDEEVRGSVVAACFHRVSCMVCGSPHAFWSVLAPAEGFLEVSNMAEKNDAGLGISPSGENPADGGVWCQSQYWPEHWQMVGKPGQVLAGTLRLDRDSLSRYTGDITCVFFILGKISMYLCMLK